MSWNWPLSCGPSPRFSLNIWRLGQILSSLPSRCRSAISFVVDGLALVPFVIPPHLTTHTTVMDATTPASRQDTRRLGSNHTRWILAAGPLGDHDNHELSMGLGTFPHVFRDQVTAHCYTHSVACTLDMRVVLICSSRSALPLGLLCSCLLVLCRLCNNLAIPNAVKYPHRYLSPLIYVFELVLSCRCPVLCLCETHYNNHARSPNVAVLVCC
ncbi:hypothetical protein K466DRAFT_268156 [Polyporus arcularius HHB13444]|uniref:Uncharacterized protein n=1 Tax=Polyporus arcularius HHB13444 TaxID=1314778 RepID=A0A5C3P0V6_9APHY|nr:hypothetical protein K466DRAFT_268156 [Polyporus arcularius HHB13444]